jgi:hypothetical protein
VNAGFSNLWTLKNELLAKSMPDSLSFDAVITALGLGVANQFERFTNRKFCYVVNDQEVFPADRCEFLLSRFPINSGPNAYGGPDAVSAEKKCNEADGFFALDNCFIRVIDQANGIINTGDIDAGRHYEQIRFTFTGGYFWNTLDKSDAGYPLQQPVGSTLLPNDLLHAWILQCRHIWKNLDKIGLDLLNDGQIRSLRFPEDFAPTVAATLNSYKRYNLV